MGRLQLIKPWGLTIVRQHLTARPAPLANRFAQPCNGPARAEAVPVRFAQVSARTSNDTYGRDASRGQAPM